MSLQVIRDRGEDIHTERLEEKRERTGKSNTEKTEKDVNTKKEHQKGVPL